MSRNWADYQGGIAGISRGNCRLFLTNNSFRESYGNTGPVLFWLNLDSKAEVDELFAQWKAAQAKILSEPEDKPWKLREFERLFFQKRDELNAAAEQTWKAYQKLVRRGEIETGAQ